MQNKRGNLWTPKFSTAVNRKWEFLTTKNKTVHAVSKSLTITSGQINLTTGRIAAAHGRFNGIRQVALVCTLPNTCFAGSTRVQLQNSISIGSAIPAGLTTVTDRPTDRGRCSDLLAVTTGRIYLRIVRRYGLNKGTGTGWLREIWWLLTFLARVSAFSIIQHSS